MADRAPVRRRASNDAERKGAIAYLRTSTGEQELSPDAQLHQIQTWAAARGIEILEVFSDVGVSSQSAVAERPHLPLAIDAVRRLRAEFLVAAVSDRLHRRSSVADEIRTLTAVAGGRVVTADGVEDGNGDGPTAWLITKILDCVAEFEVMTIRARTRAAMDVRRRNGLVVGSVPLGCRVRVIGNDDAGRPIRKLEQDPKEAAAGRLALELRGQEWSLERIGAELVRRGFEPRGSSARKQGRWHVQSVKRLIEHTESLLESSP